MIAWRARTRSNIRRCRPRVRKTYLPVPGRKMRRIGCFVSCGEERSSSNSDSARARSLGWLATFRAQMLLSKGRHASQVPGPSHDRGANSGEANHQPPSPLGAIRAEWPSSAAGRRGTISHREVALAGQSWLDILVGHHVGRRHLAPAGHAFRRSSFRAFPSSGPFRPTSGVMVPRGAPHDAQIWSGQH